MHECANKINLITDLKMFECAGWEESVAEEDEAAGEGRHLPLVLFHAHQQQVGQRPHPHYIYTHHSAHCIHCWIWSCYRRQLILKFIFYSSQAPYFSDVEISRFIRQAPYFSGVEISHSSRPAPSFSGVEISQFSIGRLLVYLALRSINYPGRLLASLALRSLSSGLDVSVEGGECVCVPGSLLSQGIF